MPHKPCPSSAMAHYTLKAKGRSSQHFGPCEVCNGHCAEVYVQHLVWHRHYPLIPEFYKYDGGSLWGHRECLLISREWEEGEEMQELVKVTCWKHPDIDYEWVLEGGVEETEPLARQHFEENPDLLSGRLDYKTREELDNMREFEG